MKSKRRDDLDSIRAYYDHNTARFLSYGGQRKTRTIHRPVWGEGVQDERGALNYVHNLIIKELAAPNQESSRKLRLLDMGCGVGASLFYLADNLDGDFQGVGLTISPVQASIARKDKQSFENKCGFILGDFLRPPLRGGFDLIYSIESFAHTADPEAFFRAAARLLKPGGRLVLCDDFLSNKDAGDGLRNKELLEIFQDGWGVSGIWKLDHLEKLTVDLNLIQIKDENLTPYLRLNPLPSSIVKLVSAGIGIMPGKNYYSRSVIGGQALQLCLANGIVEYRYLVFEKQSQ